MTLRKSKFLKKFKSIVGEETYLAFRRKLVVGVKPITKRARTFRYFLIAVLKYLLRSLRYDESVLKTNVSRNAGDVGKVYRDKTWFFDNRQKCYGVKGLSVVTLNLNAAAFIEKYLKGLAQLPLIPIEIIFVDHASSDESLEIVEKFEFHRDVEIAIIKKKFNDSYSKSNNEAVAIAKYEHVLFLNNDVVLTDRSMIALGLNLLRSDQEVGLVGWPLYHDAALAFPQHFGIEFEWDSQHYFYRPKNISLHADLRRKFSVLEFPAVTAAMMLVRKQEFMKLGGFDENYDYGYEDVDLCLRYRWRMGRRAVLVNGLSAVHVESTSQNRQNRLEVRARRTRNIQHFKRKLGLPLNRELRKLLFNSEKSLENGMFPRIGFVVTEAFEEATAGDYFTALEFSLGLQETANCDVSFFPQRGPGAVSQIDCGTLDLLIVMIDRFDLSKLINRSANIIVVAWMRNWFDRWQSWDYSGNYDFYFCSSEKARRYTLEEHGIPSRLLRIGTNSARFYSPVTQNRQIDVCFTGSKWGVEREIEKIFPTLENFETHIYGHGWPNSAISEIFKGPLKYSEVPSVYSNSKIVIDDAASSTLKWGSINSRVFDALAAGCLVITNGIEGANEFSSANDIGLPLVSYNSAEELGALITKYLADEPRRINLCKKLQSVVIDNQSYQNRSNYFFESLAKFNQDAYKISIKTPVPSENVKMEWGDYHFACSLKSALQMQGHQVRIDLLPEWNSEGSEVDEVVIVLRGLSRYQLNDHQVNVMWNISHPEKISDEEYSEYDAVFVASKPYAHKLAQRLDDTTVLPLLQCTDSRRFFPDTGDSGVPSHELLFVGNSRRVYRDVVRYSLELHLPISVYGALWEELIDQEYIKGNNIDNKILRKYYSNAKVVLNDHWESMRSEGFISNRLFDVLACGGVVVTDYVEGIEELGPRVVSFDGSIEDFKRAVDDARRISSLIEEEEGSAHEHSFESRATDMLAHIKKIYSQKIYFEQR